MFEIVTISGVENTVGMPVYIPRLDVLGGKVAGGNREVIIPMAGVEGAEVIIAPNSVTLPDGRTEGMMMFSQVQTDKVPMPAPNGTTFDLAWTLQPAGTDFYPPARIALPNSNGQALGTELEMFSFDHDLMEWVSIGPGVVSEDGSKIVSKPGHGIRHSGWGGAPPPPPDDTCNVECNDNNECTDDSKYDCGCNNDLVLPPDRAKSEQVPGNCTQETCGGGKPDDSDINEESDVQYDCKKPGCENGSPKDMPDDGDISEEDSVCKECNDRLLNNKPDNTITTTDSCLFCLNGSTEDVMGQVSGTIFVCPNQSYQYSVVVNLNGQSVSWGGNADESGVLVVSSSGTDGQQLNVEASVGACTQSLSVSVSDGRPGNTSEPGNCILNPIDCFTINGLAEEATVWVEANTTALGGGLVGGCADAARHAYFNAIGTIDLGAQTAQDFLDAHEFSNFISCDDNNMDLSNNFIGRNLAGGCTTRACAQTAVVMP